MAAPARSPGPTVCLRSPSGEPLLTLPAWPAAAALAAALALAPRLTAAAALAALWRRLSLTVDRAPGPGPADA